MSTQAPTETDVQAAGVARIEVRIQVGDALMAASDDPLFLRLTGPSGREFRLSLAHGKSLRRGKQDHYVLAPRDGSNVAHPDLNDPTSPPLDLAGIHGAVLVKGLDPLPNVRGMAEMDDRLLIEEAEVVVHADGDARLRFHRRGPVWLGLVSGLSWELARS